MATHNPFGSASNLFPGAEKWTPAAAQDAVKPMMDNMKAWSELVQSQAQAAQAVVAEAVQSFQGIKEPQAALSSMTAAAEKMIALTAKHLQEVTELSVEQFKAGVDLIQEKSPTPQAFAEVAKGLKVAASTMESATLSMLNNANVPTGKKK